MPGQPQTLLVANAIKAVMDGTGLYTTTALGGMKEYSGNVPAGVVQLVSHSTEHLATQSIKETDVFRIRSVVDYTDAAAAEAQMITIIDTLEPLFMTKTTLGGTVNTVESCRVKPNSGKTSFAKMDDIIYRVDEFEVEVRQKYYVTFGN